MVIARTKEIQETRILIVEDESIIGFNLQELLESLGYFVIAIADSGERAIRQVAALNPNVVLMDIRIKGEMDGIQAAEAIWEQFQIPIIYVTGHSDKSTVERVRLTAPFGYLLKPIKERELYVAIEAALQRSERERWLNQVLNGIGDAVIVVDSQSCIQFLNPVAQELTGWQLHEAIGQSLTTVFKVVNGQTREPYENPLKIVFQQGITLRLEGNLLLIAKNGTETLIGDSVAPFRDNDGMIAGAVLVFRDMTAQRQAEERKRALLEVKQSQQKIKELERLAQLKDDFLNTVSHELRTPLSNIKLATQILENLLQQQRLLAADSNLTLQSLSRYMEVIRDECNQEIDLVNDLLNLQQLNADVYPLELMNIDFAAWLSEVITRFEGRFQERQLNLQLDLATNLPPLVSDHKSLNRILVELLNNACKYTPPGEQIIITTQLKTLAVNEVEPPDPHFIITVANTGVDIPPEELSQIFQPFYRIPKSDLWQQGGTGLGLALVRKLVTRLHGSISVESGTGQTCFIVELPLQVIEDN